MPETRWIVRHVHTGKYIRIVVFDDDTSLIELVPYKDAQHFRLPTSAYFAVEIYMNLNDVSVEKIVVYN